MPTFEEAFPDNSESTITLSEPAITDSPIEAKAPVPAEVVEESTEAPIAADTSNQVPVEEPVKTQAPIAQIDTERLRQLNEATTYKPTETPLEILDEFGNIDSSKFETFMAKNNENVFSQAINAVNAKNEVIEIETKAWEAVHKQYPEMNETLEKAVRGARVQDLINGGSGDLLELAKGIVGPIRESRIKAVEDTNRIEREKESLAAIKPSNESPAAQAPSLMQQLKIEISKGNREGAQRIRHAILKEQIYGKNNNEN